MTKDASRKQCLNYQSRIHDTYIFIQVPAAKFKFFDEKCKKLEMDKNVWREW